jgi:SynChlorMet cassette radical SAM/SPASM protein ScmF
VNPIDIQSLNIDSSTETTRNRYPLAQLYFYLTEGCNLACRHCWLAPKFQDEKHQYATLNVNLFRSIIEQAKPLGLTSVKLTGGEPLMHPAIQEILDYLATLEITVSIETNGVLCTAGLARKIARCKNPNVSVSLDGIDAATHDWVRGVPGSYDKALEGIQHLVNAGLRPQMIFSLMRRNKEQIEAFIAMAESLGAMSVKFNLIQPTERGERLYESDQALSVKEYMALGSRVEKAKSGTKVKLFFDYPPAFQPLNRMYSAEGDGCHRCGIYGILGVLSDGSYALCGIGTSIPEMIFGQADKDSLADVWNQNPVLKDIRSNLPGKLTGICSHCLMSGLCLGACIAQNYYRSSSLWAPFWFCEGAEQQGLFPKSRMKP